MSGGPLAGRRIVEFAGIGPAPFCGMLLADLGADVVRIESPVPPRAGRTVPILDTRYDVANRGKRAVRLDLKRDEDRALAMGLVAGADALIEGFRPGVAERMGLRTEAPGGSGLHYDVLLECSGASGVLATGLRRLRPGGRAAMIGMPKEELVGLPMSQLTVQEISVSLVHRYNDTWPLAVALVASGRVDVSSLVTHHFALAETADALLLGKTVTDSIKAVVHPDR